MRNLKWFVVLCTVCFAASSSLATPDSLSVQGTLASPTDVFELTFTVGGSGSQDITVQTWGFGGGTNAAGNLIAPGGFDPFIGLFVGTGPSASVFTNNDNPAATADNLSNFTTGFGLPGGAGISTFVGCGPAGTVPFTNGDSVCGDVTMTLTLTAGNTYTLVLSDANYPKNAVFDNGTLGEGFADFVPLDSNGNPVFQTCDTNSKGVVSCITPSSAFAFDITDNSGGTLTQNVPEPGELLQLGISALFLLGGVGLWRLRYGELRE